MRTRPKYLWGIRRMNTMWEVNANGTLYRFPTLTAALQVAKEFGADLETPSGHIIQTAIKKAVDVDMARIQYGL